ncbi:MAG: nicotinamidase/pyrazinamidase, partial [Thermococcaceae archaeon]|nr:nicotinamidase/pyrazinamidase [Thermococcaceae archaeon]
LKEKGVKRVYICGVATEYCVKATALDALKHGFEVYLIRDAVKGIKPEDEEKVLKELKESGAKIISSAEL